MLGGVGVGVFVCVCVYCVCVRVLVCACFCVCVCLCEVGGGVGVKLFFVQWHAAVSATSFCKAIISQHNYMQLYAFIERIHVGEAFLSQSN